MSFTFEIVRPTETICVEIRDPEFGDVAQFARRQATGKTEGGRQFIQDLGTEEEYFLGTWTNLTRCERRDLEYFFGVNGANKRQRRFTMGIVGNKNMAFPVGTGQGWSTSDDLNSGALLVPLTASFGDVRLDQSELSFTSIPRDRYSLTMRFRIIPPAAC